MVYLISHGNFVEITVAWDFDGDGMYDLWKLAYGRNGTCGRSFDIFLIIRIVPFSRYFNFLGANSVFFNFFFFNCTFFTALF